MAANGVVFLFNEIRKIEANMVVSECYRLVTYYIFRDYFLTFYFRWECYTQNTTLVTALCL